MKYSAFSLSVAVALMALTSVSSAQFPDVLSSNIHFDAIAYVQSEGIVSGYPDGSFLPNNTINRAEFTKIMVESAFERNTTDGCNFATVGLSDLQADQWFSPYVCVAKANNIISGYPDGTFQAENKVNFAEASKIVSATFDLPLGEAGDQWFDVYVSAISNAGATPRANIMPTDELTRGEMAQMIYTIKSKDMSMTDEPMTDSAEMMTGYLEYTPELYAMLQKQNTPFILNLSASWCPTCRALDKEIDANLSELPVNTLLLKADYDDEVDLKREFGVTVQTSGVLFASDGSHETLNGRLNYDAIEAFFIAEISQ